MAPSVIVLLALILYPLAFALRNSFWFWNLQMGPAPLYYSGLDNYRMVFQVTPFGVALKNTLLLGFLGAFAQFWFGMGIALLLHTHLRGMGLMRALLIMPRRWRRWWRAFFSDTCWSTRAVCCPGRWRA